MIYFNYILIRNFMSIGNEWLKFDYKTGLTYVYGENHDISSEDIDVISNGSGKTVVLVDAPLFALYGRTQRKIKKSEIINIKNNCDCEVKLCLTKDNVEYIIERGLKPDKIIIIKDGVPENEEAKKRLANKVIEDEILEGISYEVFKNLIVLNGTSSRHFFEYGKNEKRAFINEVFRLGFLDHIQNELTEESKDKKINIDKIEIQKTAKEGEIERLKNLLEAQENGETYDYSTELNNKIIEESNKIELAKKQLLDIEQTSFDGDISKSQEKINFANNKIRETNNEIIRIDSSVSNLRKMYLKVKSDYEKISKESFCSQCTQIIPDNLKNVLMDKMVKEAEKIASDAAVMKTERDQLNNRLEQMTNWINNAKSALDIHKTKTQALQTSTVLLQEYESQIKRSNNPSDSRDKIIEEIRLSEKELSDINEQLTNYKKEYKLVKVSRDIIGGKNFYGYYIGVFRSYLNVTINEYLSKMISPHRVKFNNNLDADVVDGSMTMHSYDNLSTGEKAKINLALLLSFYDVLHSFHRMESNILILDEVLDNGIDSQGILCLHKILKEKISLNPSMCLYVVSHKESENTFAEKEGVGKVVFIKTQGFTRMKED